MPTLLETLAARGRLFAPRPLAVEEQPMAIALMLVSGLAAVGCVMPDGLAIPLVTGLAIAYQARLFVPVQLAASLYAIYTTGISSLDFPFETIGSIFLPHVLLPVLTTRWLTSIHRRNESEPDPSSTATNWEISLRSVCLVCALFVACTALFYLVNQTVGMRLFFALQPHGIRLISLILLLGGVYFFFFSLLSHYRFVTRSPQRHRMELHQTVYRGSRKEHKLLFARSRKSIQPQKENTNK